MAILPVGMAFVVSFLVVAVATPIIRRYALQRKLGDKPNGRKIHTSMIPHLGGIGMVLGVSISLGGLAILGALTGHPVSRLLLDLVAPVGMVVVLGLADDTKNLKAWHKLFVQIAASLIVPISAIYLFVGWRVLDTHLLFGILLTTFYLVGTSSSVNLIDGLDGLASGVSLISAAALGVSASLLGAPELVWIAMALVGACLGFLIYNFPPGKIFMGDTGSLFLGIMLGILTCAVTMAHPAFTTFCGVCLVLSVPVLDAWLAIARRLALKRPLFEADQLHIHHVLTSLGFSARQTLGVLYSLHAVFAVLGILAISGYLLAIVIGIAMFAFAFATFYHMMVASRESSLEQPAELLPGSVASLEK